MSKRDYVPDSDAALLQWLKNLKTQTATLPTTVLSAAQLAALTQSIDHLSLKIQEADSAEKAHHAAVQAKKAAKTADIAAIRTFVQSFKHSAGYTESIGKSLDIIGSEHAIDFNQLKPTPTITKRVNGVEIKYSKSGADGVFIYCKRGSEADFSRLEKITQSSYLDTRPNLDGAAAEAREYYLVCFVKDQPVGIASDTVKV